MKKIISVLLSLLLVAAVCVGGSLFAFADEVADEYGTYENGIIPQKGISDTKITPTDKFMNGDFQEGFRYWTCRDTKGSGMAPATVAKLVTEGDNTFIELTPKNEYDGIISPYFNLPEAKIGMKLAVLYKWRGEGPMKIFVEHQNGTEPSTRVCNGQNKILYEAKDEKEWNISMSGSVSPIMELKAGTVDQTHRFKVGVQIINDIEAKLQVDDVQVCIYRDDTNKLYTLDGATVVADIAAMEKAMEDAAAEEEGGNESDSDFEFEDTEDTDNSDNGSTTNDDLSFEDKEDDKSDNADAKEDADAEPEEEDNKSFIGGVWFWVIIGVVVVAIAAGVVFFVLKKKKSVPATDEPSTEE